MAHAIPSRWYVQFRCLFVTYNFVDVSVRTISRPFRHTLRIGIDMYCAVNFSSHFRVVDV